VKIERFRRKMACNDVAEETMHVSAPWAHILRLAAILCQASARLNGSTGRLSGPTGRLEAGGRLEAAWKQAGGRLEEAGGKGSRLEAGWKQAGDRLETGGRRLGVRKIPRLTQDRRL